MLSVGLGLAFVFVAAAPSNAALLRTPELLGVLALLILPLVTAWNLERNRRLHAVRGARRAPGGATGGAAIVEHSVSIVSSVTAPSEQPRMVAPPELARTARRNAVAGVKPAPEDVIVIDAELLRAYRRPQTRAQKHAASERGGETVRAAPARAAPSAPQRNERLAG